MFVTVPPLHQLWDEEEGGELLSVRLRRFQGAKAFPDRVGKLKVGEAITTPILKVIHKQSFMLTIKNRFKKLRVFS